MALPRTVAIDGPAGAGKSSICRVVARDLGYLFVDTGAFYRAVTLAVIRAGLLDADDAAIIRLTSQLNLDIVPQHDQYAVLLNGEDVTQAIQQSGVDANVSRISAISGVRAVLNEKYRQLAARGPVIMAGRDIGTVVLPQADLKIYLDASPEARAERRYRQRIAGGQQANYDEILSSLRSRDASDSQREVDPLRRPSDATYVHTDDLDIESAIRQVKQIILNWQPAH